MKGHGFSRAIKGSSIFGLQPLREVLYVQDIPRGLKPAIFLGYYGTGEAVPFQNSLTRENSSC